jgi:hypothetical protein
MLAISGNNRIFYRVCKAATSTAETRSHVGFQAALLKRLGRAASLPNVLLAFNFRNVPVAPTYELPPIPILSFSTSALHWDIPWPSKQFAVACSDRREQVKKSLGEFNKVWWPQAASARGSTRSAPRVLAASKLVPGIIKSSRKKGLPLASASEASSHRNRNKYRLQLHLEENQIDGTPLPANAVLIKQDTQEEMFYDGLLHPNVHFIPVRSDLSDLASQVSYAVSHKAEVDQIATNVKALMQKELSEEGMFCYMHGILKKISLLQKFKLTTSQLQRLGFKEVS